MNQAIGGSLALAVGVAACPIPIITVILMLLSRRPRANSAAFLVGWIVGVLGVVCLVVAVAGATSVGSNANPSTGASWLKIGLGVGLLALALREWKKRPRVGEEPRMPKWLASIEGVSPLKAAGLGLLLSALNPKSLLLIVAAGLAIDQGATTTSEKAVAIVVFTIIAVSTVAVPVVLNLVLGQRARATLDRANTWLRQNNATVMAVLLLIIAVVLIGRGISDLGM
jgi:threonine/homoserine/homoserine lactone efflux protein